MFNVSSAYQTAIKQPTRTVKASVGIGNKSITNMVVNGDFSNGVTSWSGTSATTSVVNGELNSLATATSGYSKQALTTIIGNKYYCRARVKSTTALANFGLTSVTRVYHSGSGNYETLSIISTAINTSHALCVADARTSGWTTLCMDDVIVIDLTTTYGAGNEPSKEFMDELISKVGWFSSTKNVPLYWLDNTSIGSFSVESSFGNNNIPIIGATVSNKLNLELLNGSSVPQVLINTPIRPYSAIDIGGGVYEWVRHGEFYADYSDVEITKLTTSIEAYDDMAGYDQYEYTTTLTLPQTVSDIKADLTTRYGITFATQLTLPNPSLTSIPQGTLRQVISQLAGLMTTNATVDENGDVKFVFLTSSGFSMDKSNYMDFKLKPDSQIKISQLQVKLGDTITSVGDSTGYALQFENPQIVTSADLTTVFNRAFPLNFYGYTMKAQGMPHLQIGDTISFTYLKLDGSTVTITIPIINHKFSFNGGMKSEFNTSAPKEDSTTITITGGSTLGRAVDQTYVDLLSAMDSSMRIMTGNEGGYVVTILDENGKPKELVISDNQDINNSSSNVWVWNSGGLTFNTGGYKSTNPANYKIALTNDGQLNASAMTTGNMSAQRVTTGKLQDKNGLSWIDLDTGKFSFGGGKLAWDGSAFTILYNGTDLDSALNGKASTNTLQPYVDNIVIDANGLTIGKAGNPFKVNIDNQSVEFLDFGTGGGSYTPDPNAVAYITGKKMFITDLETTNSVKVGNHQIVKYDSNITLIKYVG